MSKPKQLIELLAPFNYQPQLVPGGVDVFVQINEMGCAKQIIDSRRDKVIDEFGVEHEVLVLIPKDN